MINIHFEVVDPFGSIINTFFHKLPTLPNKDVTIVYGGVKYTVISIEQHCTSYGEGTSKVFNTQTIVKVR